MPAKIKSACAFRGDYHQIPPPISEILMSLKPFPKPHFCILKQSVRLIHTFPYLGVEKQKDRRGLGYRREQGNNSPSHFPAPNNALNLDVINGHSVNHTTVKCKGSILSPGFPKSGYKANMVVNQFSLLGSSSWNS